ncbi:protein of unknown function DUF1555 [Glaciecola sp. 4H-3-7+YE-5]|nr:protein of unknown function DUF1555 [Glaciecola sp. 4H-3-7+YE-5]
MLKNFIKFGIINLLLVQTTFAFASLVTWDAIDGGNGHVYQTLLSDGISRTEANQIAINSGGYLVTITSQEEQDFILQNILIPNSTSELFNFAFWTGGYATNTDLNSLINGDSPGWAWQNGEAWNFDNGVGISADGGGTDEILSGGVGPCDISSTFFCPLSSTELASFMRVSAYESAGQVHGNWSDLRNSGTLPTMEVDFLTGDITSPLTLVNRIGGYIVEYDSKPLLVSEPATMMILIAGFASICLRRRKLFK